MKQLLVHFIFLSEESSRSIFIQKSGSAIIEEIKLINMKSPYLDAHACGYFRRFLV